MFSRATATVITELSKFLCERREQIISDWLRVVEEDRRLETPDRLSAKEVRDHVPKLLSTFCELMLSETPSREFSATAGKDAQMHGYERWQQGYSLQEVFREISQLRTVLVWQITEFEAAQGAALSSQTLATARARVHRFLDDLAAQSAQRFVDEQKAEIERVNSDLEKANASRMRLIATVSHELRNALNGLSMAAQLLTEEGVSGVQQMQGVIERNTSHMRELLDDLLDLSTLVAGQKPVRPAPFAADALLRDIADTYRPMAEAKALRFEAECDAALGELMTDELKVRQIASNLVSNAIKYTAQGKVRLAFKALDGEQWAIVVQDTGVGIAPEHRENVFADFYRVDQISPIRGVGLGLPIVVRLVELLGGRIELSSHAGTGTLFTVTLPHRHETRESS